MKKKLNFREWWDEVGTAHAASCAAALGSSLKYFSLVRNGHKGIGTERALKVIDWAKANTPGFVPDLELLLRGVPRSAKKPRAIQPSAAFVRSSAARRGAATKRAGA